MCNLCSITAGQTAIRKFTRAMCDRTGNLPPLPGVFPDTAVPIETALVSNLRLARGDGGTHHRRGEGDLRDAPHDQAGAHAAGAGCVGAIL